MHCHQILASFYPWFLLHFFPLLLFLATGSRELSNSSRFPTKNNPPKIRKNSGHIPSSHPGIFANSRHQIVSPRFPTYHLPAPLHHHTLNLKMCLKPLERRAKNLLIGVRGFCFIIQANTSPACSINWNTSQVERDSASATELVMRTRPRAYSFDSYPCTGRPDVPERLQRMTPHSSWNRASQISFRIELIHLIQLPFSEVSEINYTSQSTLLSLLEDVWPVPLIDQRPWSSPVQSQVKNVYGGSVKYVFVQTSHFDILNFLRIETFEPCHSSSITTM